MKNILKILEIVITIAAVVTVGFFILFSFFTKPVPDSSGVAFIFGLFFGGVSIVLFLIVFILRVIRKKSVNNPSSKIS